MGDCMILVTGGGGYVGSLLVPELLALGESVRVVDVFWFEHRLQPHARLETINGDIRDADPAPRSRFAPPCAVYYTAAQESDADVRPKREDSLAAPTANYSKTKRLAELEVLKLPGRDPPFFSLPLRAGALF